MKKIVILTFALSVLFCCKNQKNAVNPILLKEIKDYIKKSENEAKKTDLAFEHDIYLIIFSKKDSLKKVTILENTYFFEKNLDGFISVGDNMIFFYHSNEDLVKKDLLEGKVSKDTPNENSETAKDDALDSEAWTFLIEDNNSSLKRIREDTHNGFGI